MPFVQREQWASVVLVVTVTAFAVAELWQALRWRRTASRVDVRGEVLFRVVFLAAVLVLPLARSLAPDAVLPGPGVFVVGAVICWSGLLLRWWSFRTLGASFTIVLRTSPEQVIISDGPYRLLRHPSYTGLLAAFLGCGLMLGNWAGAIASSVLVLGGLVDRIRREEQAMLATFGDAYADFAEQRARLIPFVW